MRAVALLLLATVATASWLGDEYWTLIGPRGEPIQGDPANFALVARYFKPEESNVYVAYWMTSTHYPGHMYEQFGEAWKQEEDGEVKFCANFTGKNREAVKTCENFRILTVPDRYRGQAIFEWVTMQDTREVKNQVQGMIGYNDHFICGFGYGKKTSEAGVTTYEDFGFGDAAPLENTANIVNKFYGTGKRYDYFENYLLKLLVGENTAQQNIPRLPSPPTHEQHLAHRLHVERRSNVDHMQQQAQQDAEYARRLAEYNEKLRQQQEQSANQDQQAQQDADYQRRLAEHNEKIRQQQLQQQQQREQYDREQQHSQHQQQQQIQVHATHQQTADNRFICDTYGRVFEMRTGEDGRTRYHVYDVAAHGGIRPPCTLIGETAGQSSAQEGGVVQPVQLQQQERQQEQRPYPVRRSCSGSRQKKDAEDDC